MPNRLAGTSVGTFYDIMAEKRQEFSQSNPCPVGMEPSSKIRLWIPLPKGLSFIHI